MWKVQWFYRNFNLNFEIEIAMEIQIEMISRKKYFYWNIFVVESMKTKIHPHICIQTTNTRLPFGANVDETSKGKQILVISRLASFTLVLSVCSLLSSLKTSAAAPIQYNGMPFGTCANEWQRGESDSYVCFPVCSAYEQQVSVRHAK